MCQGIVRVFFLFFQSFLSMSHVLYVMNISFIYFVPMLMSDYLQIENSGSIGISH